MDLGLGRCGEPDHCLSPEPAVRQSRDQRAGARCTIYCGLSLIAAVLAFVAFLGLPTDLEIRPWYLLGLLGIAALAIDTMLAAAPETSSGRWGRLTLAAFIALVSFPPHLKAWKCVETNMDLVAAAVQQRALKGDLIVATVWHYGIGLERYYTGPIPWMTLPPIRDIRIHRYDLLKEQMMAADQQTVVGPVIAKSPRVEERRAGVVCRGAAAIAGASPARDAPAGSSSTNGVGPSALRGGLGGPSRVSSANACVAH